jgi:hypothetical protein
MCTALTAPSRRGCRMPPDAETAEVVDLEPETGELVRYEPTGPITLFGTTDPRIALERMSEIAKALWPQWPQRAFVQGRS